MAEKGEKKINIYDQVMSFGQAFLKFPKTRVTIEV
jgi:hypothetical protein